MEGAGEAEEAALEEGDFASEEEAAEAFWLAIGLGLAATVVMTISIWYEETLADRFRVGNLFYVLVNTCSFGLFRRWKTRGRSQAKNSPPPS